VALQNLVDAAAGDALIILEAGNLTKRSTLRTLAETEPCLAAVPCYPDSEAELERLVENAARQQGLAVADDALEWIVERIGGDRGQTRSEIDKLMLYKAGDASKTLTLDDALSVLGDTAAIGLDDVIAATFDGDLVSLDRSLERVFAEGGNPVQLVRAVQRHTDQLHLVSGHVAKGERLEAAMFRARGLPKGGPVRLRFQRHLQSWPLHRLSAALGAILEAEIQCKSTNLPDEAIARRLCLRLAQFAKAAKERR
jgi:DNA polymerase III subunit delta